MAALSVAVRVTGAFVINREQFKRDPAYKPSNEKSGNKCGNFKAQEAQD